MNKKSKKKSSDLPMSFEEHLRQTCPAIFEWSEEGVDESIAGSHEIDPRSMRGMSQFDPDEEANDEFDDPNDPTNQWLAANHPTPNFASAQRGGYDHPSNTSATKVTSGLGGRLPSANRTALIGQISQRLQGMDPQALAALLKQLG